MIDKWTEYLEKGVSPYHTVAFCEERLLEKGFQKLSKDTAFDVKAGQGYYVKPYDTMLVAFAIGEKITDGRMHLACAHTDSPCFRLKPNPELPVQSGYVQVNVEPYGGMLKRSWFDRPLGVAGRVLVKSEDVYAPRELMFDSEVPWFVLPSLAPHMDRDIEKKELDVQKECMPILTVLNTGKTCDIGVLLNAVAKKLAVNIEDILDFDLYLYNQQAISQVGLEQDMMLAPRIDNLASVAALTDGIAVPKQDYDISMIALFDNEEIGSRSKQGADSVLLNWVVEKLFESPLFAKVSFKDAMMKSMMLSVDGAHGLHPNYKEKSDGYNTSVLGSGVVFKSSASQRYLTDSKATAILMQLCDANGIAYQKQANRSGNPGGQTLGPIAASYLPMLGMDLGLPMLAMHSSMELIHEQDYKALETLMRVWLS